MAVNPAIAMGVRGIELADPLAQYGKVAAIQGAQQQNALAQLQMRQAEREQEATNALNAAYRDAYNPQTGDVDVNRLRLSLATGGYGSKLPDIEKKLGELKTQRLTQQKTEGEIAGQGLTRSKTEGEILDAALKRSRGFLENLDPSAPGAAEAYLAWHEANHKDPIIGPALAARGVTADQSRGRIMQLLNTPGGLARLINESKLGTEKFMELNKPTTQVIDQSGQRQVIQLPGLGGAPTTVGTYADVPLPPEVQAQKLQQSAASAPRITVSTEKKYGERFGGLIADADAAKLSAAEGAPKAAATADRIMDILESGKVFTGTGADVRLQLAKALNLAGKTDEEKIANTEVLGARLAETTLGAIKSSNLGAGQGFTNTDREFLEKAKAGKITFEAESLKRLAKLSRQAAEQSAEAWNKRVKQIPASALEGTGITAEPVVVPKRGKKAEAATPAPAGVDPALWNVMTPQERALWQK